MTSIGVSPSLKIRHCSPDDLKRIEEIEEMSFEDPYPLSLFQSLLSEHPWGFRVAVSIELVVGYCILIPANEYEGSLLIASVAIDPLYRSKGMGTRLIKDAISISRSYKKFRVRQIMLQVRENNHSAISLYSKLGFRKVSIIPDYYGVGKDALEMRLDL